MKCAMCHQDIQPNAIGWANGHNGEPVVKGQVCDNCNKVIVEHRIRLMYENEARSASNDR